MPAYAYKGMDARGKSVSGVRDAESPRALRASLKREGIFVSELRETHEKGATGQPALHREIDFKRFFDRVKPQDIAVLTRQHATLLGAGIPLAEALQALLEQTTSEKLARAIAEVRTKVNAGSALGDALAEHPDYFSELYVNMVRAGEAAGNLEQVLVRLADFMDAQVRLRSKVGAALAYPAVMGVVAAGITGLLMTVVVPKITQIFSDFGRALPWYTQLLIGTSELLAGYWWLILPLLVLGWRAFSRWRRSSAGKARWDAFLLRLWMVGPMVRMIAVGRFSSTLGTMLTSGVPLLTALDIAKSVLGNVVLVDVVDRARDAVREGEALAVPLAKSGHFPPVVTRMIAVGERSGQLESMLQTVAATYETEIDLKLQKLTRMLEPLMIVIMGVVVGFIVFSILSPIFQMNDIAGDG